MHIPRGKSVCLDRSSGRYLLRTLLLEGALVFNDAFCPGGTGRVLFVVQKYIHVRGGAFVVGSAGERVASCSIEIQIGEVELADIASSTVFPWPPRGFYVEHGCCSCMERFGCHTIRG